MASKERVVVKKVSNCVIYSDGTIRIDNVRASYPHLDAPYATDDDKAAGKKGAYGIVGLLPKDTHGEAKSAIKEFIQKMMTDNDTKVSTDKWFLKDGDESDKAESEGMWTVSARESKRPTVRKRSGEVMTVEEVEESLYGGCWVNLLIRPWYQDGVKVGKGYGKRINAGLVAVQFVRDDEPFGEGRITDEGVFDAVDGDDGDDGL